MVEKIRRTLERERLAAPGELIHVGLSGGPDSMALISVLSALSGEMGFRLAAIHVEHGIRGADSLRDAEFVREYCRKQNIPLTDFSVNVPARAREGLTLEEAARAARYECFQRALDGQPGKVALAHHLDDQAETIVMMLLRGGGPRAMAGMDYQRGPYIRPMLDVSRAEILIYLHEKGIPCRYDATNGDPSYERNRIRMELMPRLKAFNPNLSATLARNASVFRKEDQYLDEKAEAFLRAYVGPEMGGLTLNKGALGLLPLALQRRVLRLAAERLHILKDLTFEKVEESLFALREGRRSVQWLRNRVFLVGRESCYLGMLPRTEPVPLAGQTVIDLPGWRLIVVASNGLRDAAARFWQPGDHIVRGGRTVKLKEELQKYEVWQRKTYPVIARGSQVLWTMDHGFLEENPGMVLRIERQNDREAST
ncbi:tRNA lysidine(34) synthetase TilS [Gehongia tenuis]|uniref:tRNA(Ile)-lysidine synthase n=1 Tax=Gehongia tenuis TaxID=2763655 RepID=A0A926HLM1_9FIRM|nr:tRNA lysidine(34) synthetase TilS [Gehongia tenuis]MBC8532232.1 tRNA lysidine(34) synthetase TilS [Gehongia tenuis]